MDTSRILRGIFYLSLYAFPCLQVFDSRFYAHSTRSPNCSFLVSLTLGSNHKTGLYTPRPHTMLCDANACDFWTAQAGSPEMQGECLRIARPWIRIHECSRELINRLGVCGLAVRVRHPIGLLGRLALLPLHYDTPSENKWHVARPVTCSCRTKRGHSRTRSVITRVQSDQNAERER